MNKVSFNIISQKRGVARNANHTWSKTKSEIS